MKIDWKKIKDGYNGFEKLAVDYVNDMEQCQGCKWVHTKNTRDSNHDAILVKETDETTQFNTAIFVGYSNNIDTWWMEAKYSSSENNKMLPRYRLDATIVSAILSKNLKKVVFVTNLTISSKTMFDIRKALIAGSSCEVVIFCTKNELETWLLNKDYNIFKKYFGYSEYEFKNLTTRHLITNSGLVLYEIGENLFHEAQNIVYSGFVYEINFSITVYRKCFGELISITNIENKTENIKKINLLPGINHFSCTIRIADELEYETITAKDVYGECKSVLPPSLMYEISNYEDNIKEKISIYPNDVIDIIDSNFFHINIPSQQKLCDDLFDDSKKGLYDFNRKTTIFCINGKSGVGKSYMLQQYKHLVTGKIPNFLCSSYIFTGDQSYDIGVLKKFLFNLFFPYINYIDIDHSYLWELKKETNKISDNYWKLVLPNQDIDFFMKFSLNKEEIENIFPWNVSVNKKIVIFDDLHKLNDKLFIFLFNIIEYLSKHNFSIYCILASQKPFKNLIFQDSRNTSIISKELDVTNEDIVDIINKKLGHININRMQILFGSVIEVVYFLKYITNTYDTIENYDDFRLVYNVFKNSEILRNEIIVKFKDIFKKYPNIEAICSCIYYTDSGISFDTIQQSEELMNAISILIETELIRKNNNDFYVPWHDYYKKIYTSHFPLKECNNIHIPFKTVYDLKILLTLEKFDKEILEHLLEELNKLYSNQKYYSIYYILENLFLEKESRKKFKNQVSNEHYFILFAFFCYANTNAGWKYSGYEKFFELYLESINNKNHCIQSIHYIILWEIINSLYEAGEFKEALEKVKIFHKIPKTLRENWHYIFQWDLQSLTNSVNSVNILIDSENGVNCLHQIVKPNKLLLKDVCFTTYRIILANLVNDFNSAKKLLYDYNNIIQTDKRYDIKSKYMYDFTVKFFECMDDLIDISEVISANENLKSEFLNDYNRHIYIISLLALIKKDINLCEEYSYEYLKSSRKLKNRRLAFREAYLALINLYNNNISETIEHLEKELSYLNKYETYLPIIIHNLNFVKNNKFQIDNVLFYCGDKLLDNAYYIDIRMLY